ncbi:MAG: 3-phosphoshikimate 1-carboxyvinyltransferase [Acidobacteria bacterium]|nr:3-phosphoshikimate 1-carboxyvinyltransferase [Acidobacteriota bacterium]
MPGNVFPGPVSGTVSAPASKSFMQRAVACALLSDCETEIQNPALSADGKTALRLAGELGAAVGFKGKHVVIRPGARPADCQLNAGESGLSLRMFTPIAAKFPFPINISAAGSLRRRPVEMMEAPLLRLGVRFVSAGGYPPVQVRGPLQSGRVELDASLTSQFLSGLLVALPGCNGDSEILVSGLTSRPYVEMTLSVLASFGVHWEKDEGNQIVFRCSGGQRFHCPEFTVPGDWSGAAGILTAGAVAGSVTVTGLPQDKLQADRTILEILEQAGARVSVSGESVTVSKNRLNAFRTDVTHCPDLVPVLTALAIQCRGESTVTGTKRLKFKESDRAVVLHRELKRLGAEITLEEDCMRIRGGQLRSGRVSASGDHRIAMALAVSALNADGPVEIGNTECVDKSYPAFFKDLTQIGVKIQ